MQRCAYFIAVACIFGAWKIDLIFDDETQNESETHNQRSPTNQNRDGSVKSKMTLEVPPQSDYLCNNATFDWIVQTLVSKIAQLTEVIQEKEEELTQLQQKLEEHEEFYSYYVKQIEVRYEEELEEFKQKARKPADCADVQRNGHHYSGIYKIYPTTSTPNQEYSDGTDVFCDMNMDKGGWTVLQRRLDGSEGFDRNWSDYKEGFGHLSQEFWIGNEKIHLLTQQRHYILRIDMVHTNGSHFYAQYDDFYTESEGNNYRLHVGQYSGNSGDAMPHHNGLEFSTVDKDHDLSESGNCAELFGGGGWWFGSCYDCNLNGQYGDGLHQQGIVWYTLNYDHSPLQAVSMTIRPADYQSHN